MIMIMVIFAHWCRLNAIDSKVIKNYNISTLTNENLVVDLYIQCKICVRRFSIHPVRISTFNRIRYKKIAI